MLSDACFDFLNSVAEAAEELARSVYHYSDPEFPLQYGVEIDALRAACARLREQPFNVDAGAELLRLCKAVLAYHDTPPSSELSSERRAELMKLVHILQSELTQERSELVKKVVFDAVTKPDPSDDDVSKFKKLLSKLSKGGYDIVVKIISDIGSATLKKMLGLN